LIAFPLTDLSGSKKRPAAGRHTPDFYIDESGMALGVPAMSYLVIDYMSSAGM